MAYYYKSNVLADGPIRYYRCDEATGTTATDLGSQARNGTYTGGVTLSQTGLILSDPDTAVLLNGSSGYLSMPTTGLPTGASAWTIEAWVKFPSLPGSGHTTIFSLGNGGAGTGATLYIESVGDFFLWDGSTATNTPANSAVAGTITYLVMLYTGTVLKCYINAGTPTSATTTLNMTYGTALIGTDASLFFGGYIDEIAVYNKVLPASRITSHYNAGLADPTLMACISGNEGGVSGFYQGSVGG